jgi:hypothetical protein
MHSQHERKFVYKFQDKTAQQHMHQFKAYVHEETGFHKPLMFNSVLGKTKEPSEAVPIPVFPKEYIVQNASQISYDQGGLGSCVANATAYAVNCQFPDIAIARLFQYLCRLGDGTPISEDSGTFATTAAYHLKNVGYVPEHMYPYEIEKFDKLPPATVLRNASQFSYCDFAIVEQTLPSIKTCLFQNSPIIFGIMIYTSFMSNAVATTGMVPMPNLATETCMGGHCVCMIGWKTIGSDLYFVVKNSWGPNWGDKGCFYLPANYVLSSSLSSDFVSYIWKKPTILRR